MTNFLRPSKLLTFDTDYTPRRLLSPLNLAEDGVRGWSCGASSVVRGLRDADRAQLCEFVCGLPQEHSRHHRGHPQARSVRGREPWSSSSQSLTSSSPSSRPASVSFCRNCERFLSPPAQWTIARPESPELLSLCLKKLKSALARVRLTDAHFIWTEPHSKRLRISLTIQASVLASTILEQTFEVEFLVQGAQCPDCAKIAAKNTWAASVQVRQKVDHKRTFLWLEQVILKQGAQRDTVSVKEVKDGLDFFYASRSHAVKMVEFLAGVVPVRSVEFR